MNTMIAHCTITGTSGRTIRTNSAADVPAGSLFATVLTGDGKTAGHWLVESWQGGSQAACERAMATLWRTASAGTTVVDGDYGLELVFALAGGAVRACPDGTYVRLVDSIGDPVDGGSAYWVVDEWCEDPVEVLGAILGGAASMADA